jgi:hypothetical protein
MRLPEHFRDDPLHGLEESNMQSTRIIQHKSSKLMLVISLSVERKPLCMSDNALRSRLLSPFECDPLVLGRSTACHADAWYVVQQA